MKYHELDATPHKNRKRVGRGIAAGQGKTAGRGTKGQSSRTGKKIASTFMGGQGALVQRIPKAKGFKSLRVPAQVVYLDQLNDVKPSLVDNTALYEAGLIGTPFHSVKVIARGDYTGKADLRVQAASASVVASITKNGGTFEAVPVNLPETRNAAKAEKKEAKTSANRRKN